MVESLRLFLRLKNRVRLSRSTVDEGARNIQSFEACLKVDSR